MAVALATVSELASYLQLDPVDTATAELAIAGASGAVRAHCGWNITEETATFTVTGNGGRYITLPTLRLNSIDAILVDGVAVDLTEYPAPSIYTRGQINWRLGWPADAKIDVTCVHGHPTAPDVIRLIVLSMAARLYTNPEGARQASVGTVSRTYDNALLSELDMRLLDAYRI